MAEYPKCPRPHNQHTGNVCFPTEELVKVVAGDVLALQAKRGKVIKRIITNAMISASEFREAKNGDGYYLMPYKL